ncbi:MULTISPECIES: hypothetical protein [Methanobacterium]|uniref:Uncharacterized protein n=1 Tax=Methanobacterium bryantii TaxID=2161 RepID=A0A2A2H0Y2_METBR|nr:MULTISPECIES: hypothetical protein [Methanobacterium]OEC88612.1 hypothetical protein A9507_03785 [Methanobacterium sp. A39]PAV02990.1 hypothetical protein ASJ80_04085 [Methanobacterium bryantii]
MNKNAKIINYGLLVWLIPSLITVILGSFLAAINIFEIISAVAIAVTVMVFSYLYLKVITENFLKESVLIGISWLIISIALDIILILLGISQLTLINYTMYVAPLYIIIPAITIGLGLYMNQRMNNVGD